MAKKQMIFDAYATGFETYILEAIRTSLHRLQTCIPAIVQSVPSRDTVVAIPAVEQLDGNWETVPWAEIKLPVHTPCGSGIIISSPLTAGDTGWIIAGDLDPSLFIKTIKQKAKPARQNILMRHDYQFGFFIPDKITGYEIASEDNGALVIQTKDGKTKISLKENTINIASGAELNINASNVTINGSSKVTINGKDWETHQHQVPTAIPVQVTLPSGEGATTEPVNTGGVR